MILTDRAKEDFEKQFCGILPKNKIELYAHIIDWFDNIGLKILPCVGLSGWYCEVKDFNNKEFGNYKCFLIVKKTIEDYKTRTEAIKKAIEKCNEIYNNLNK